MANYKSNYTGQQIDASVEKIIANSATNGQVLTADGSGSASWQDAQGGNTPKVIPPEDIDYIWEV